MAPCRKNDLSGPQASLLHAFCACNYIHLPLPRQHKTNVPVSRFTPSRHFSCKCNIMRRPCSVVGVLLSTFVRQTRLNLFTASFMAGPRWETEKKSPQGCGAKPIPINNQKHKTKSHIMQQGWRSRGSDKNSLELVNREFYGRSSTRANLFTYLQIPV